MGEEAELGVTIKRLMAQEYEKGLEVGRSANALLERVRTIVADCTIVHDSGLRDALARELSVRVRFTNGGLLPLRSEESSPARGFPMAPVESMDKQTESDPKQALNVWDVVTDLMNKVQKLEQAKGFSSRGTSIDAIEAAVQAMETREVEATKVRGSGAVEHLRVKVAELSAELHSMRGVFCIDGQQNADTLRKRLDKLEGADRACTGAHNNRVEREDGLQEQINELRAGLGKRLAEVEERAEGLLNATTLSHNPRLDKLEHDHAIHTECINGQAEHLKKLDKRLTKVETRPEPDHRGRLMVLETSIEKLSKHVIELRAWRSNTVKLGHVDTLAEHSQEQSEVIANVISRVKDLEDRYNRAGPMRGA